MTQRLSTAIQILLIAIVAGVAIQIVAHVGGH
jgi:hypothetical protein